MKLDITVNNVLVQLDLPGLKKSAYETAASLLQDALRHPGIKNRDVICEAFLYVLRESRRANASDLWHHVVYRLYCQVYGRHRPQDPKQSWVRASGEALEIAVERWYTPVLLPHRIRIKALISGAEKKRALEAMGLRALVGGSKLDMALYVEISKGDWQIFGGVHVKASLAERVSDDVPASRAMMKKGYFSPLWTLDVKSFPPPHGDLINRGELGSPANPSDKRRYIEEHGDFDGCYSANSRSNRSVGATTSGKRIYRLNLRGQPDQFATDLIARANQWRSATVPKRQ